ncbi:hypothetical protein [Geodermatophilus poikilotrophus]|uniref:Uncharacterized protein n=1 Tax=Geodermatophilus poikilotrophus TaxID=1333667 RepID=A0A1I0IRX6_9ACTN|nr:hypothetical protein [Geodermatophilus poikilotrophus]SET99180.1 hypothetical protein SAMN04488546_4579 [Geodermatophilus poikilotrophus]
MTTTSRTADVTEDSASSPLARGTQALTALVHIKPGRREQLRQVLATVGERIASGQPGPLDEIGTVHFARWVILPDYGEEGGLLFTTNYDPPWDRYIQDFAEKAPDSFQLIYDNCVGWPEGGATDIEAFKKYIRDNSLPSDVYYRAYPMARVREVKSALRLKQSFIDALDEASR